jgi:hypothetical protein
MKRMFLITGMLMVSLMVVLGGCSPDKVAPPAAEVYSGTPATVRVSLSSATIASGGAATVTATVTDADASACPKISVTFSVISAASGTLSPVTMVTDSSGVATTQFTAADVNETATIRASVAVGTNTVSDSAVITIGNPVRTPTAVSVSLSPTTLPATGGVATVTATATDSTGPVSGVTVTFSTSNASAGSLSATTATTNTSGIATVTYTANAGNTIVDVRVAAGTVNNSATLQIGTPPPPTPASIIVAVNPLSVGINSQATVNVTLQDASGAPAFNNPVTLTITSGSSLASFNTGTLSTINLTTNSSGVASAPIYAGVSSGAVTVQATSGGLSPASASFLITSDPATISINIVNSNLINGQTTNITANVKNAMNNAVSDGTTVHFAIASLPPFAGALSAAAASTVNGIASVTFTADAIIPGAVIIQATAGTLSPAQSIIIVNAAQAGSLEFVSATPNIINIKGAGTSDSVVKFKVLSSASAPLANQSVNFQLTGPSGATLDMGGGTSSTGSTDAQGEVTTIVHAGKVAGPINIVASTTVPGPPSTTLYAASGGISIGGGVPSYKWFSLSVEKFNIDGLNCDNVTDTIFVNMADRFGNYNILAGTSVSFHTAFGAIDTSNITNDKGQTQSVFRSQIPRPGDGLVRILVQTTGEEHFTDLDADGVYTTGIDDFNVADDLPEPYIDANHNDGHDTGEIFFQWPAGITGATSGYNLANGVWDSGIPIWRTVDVWMTGPPDVTKSKVVCCDPANPTCLPGAAVSTPITIDNGKSTVCYVYASDQNGNALIGGTKASLAADKTDATTKLYSGSDTFIDHPLSVSGPVPEIVGFTVTNNTASATDVTTTLSATVDWPGKCGAIKVTIPYPSMVTLTRKP